MDVWTSAFTNLGIGTAMCLTMVWFLRYLVTVTLPDMVKTFADQLEKERAATERRHKDLLARVDRLEEAQGRRHEENRADFKDQRHMIKSLDGSVATFMAAVGEHLGVIHRPAPEKKTND